jgi:hypothetical protein
VTFRSRRSRPFASLARDRLTGKMDGTEQEWLHPVEACLSVENFFLLPDQFVA